jgi:hypothetical protein
MNRHDYFLGQLHIIVRGYTDPQYGALLWGGRSKTLDIWFNKTLFTFRRKNGWR